MAVTGTDSASGRPLHAALHHRDGTTPAPGALPVIAASPSPDWHYGPVQLWLRPHVPPERGEPVARQVLGQVLGDPAHALDLRRDDRGRPYLGPAWPGYDINWSHSSEALLVAMAQGWRIGVDMERQRPRPRALELARRYFDASEADWLQSLAEPERMPAFLRLWCAKEAILKAHGHGLSFGLHRFRLEVDAAGTLQLAGCDPALGQPGDWQLHDWAPLPDYVAAVAWRRPFD